MSSLDLQVSLDGTWHSAATLEFADEAAGDRGPCTFEYAFDYLQAWLPSTRPDAAVSAALPLQFYPTECATWPAFLDDVRPMANARRWWLNWLNLPDNRGSDFRVLRQGTATPIGNLRIVQSLPRERVVPVRLPIQAVMDREHDFIAWAAEHGAQVGGATGAGGESPKLLLRREPDDQVWIDVFQDQHENAAAHVLVKFARSYRERDRLILRSEYVYCRALARLGVDTISVDGLELREGPAGPSLWMPRFDVHRRDGREVRLGAESVYSLMGAGPGARLRHQQVLEKLRTLIPRSEWPRLTREYVRRDLLNLVFGNSDNHGRNTAVLKRADGLWLAPVYDFAPMKLDPEGIARSTTWGEFERGGDVDWRGLLPTFGEFETVVRDGLRELAERLTGLPALLRELELPQETLEFPSLGLLRTEARLREWGLL